MAGNLPLGGSRGTTPSVAWNGAHFGVAWASQVADEGDIHFALVHPDGAGSVVGETAIQEGAGTSAAPSVVASGDGFTVVWRDSDGVIRGRAVDGSGAPSGDAFDVAPTGNADARPSGAATDAGTVVTWSDVGKSVVARLGSGGVAEQVDVPAASFPAVAASEGAAAVAWSEGASVGFSELDPGDLTMQAPVKRAATAANLSLAGASGKFIAAWEDTRSGEEEVYLAWLDGDAEVKAHSEPGSANWPSVVSTGSNVAVAYYQFRDGPPQIFLSLLDADLGRTGDDLEVTTDGASRFPSLAWNGSRFAVAWAVKDGPVEMTLVECQ